MMLRNDSLKFREVIYPFDEETKEVVINNSVSEDIEQEQDEKRKRVTATSLDTLDKIQGTESAKQPAERKKITQITLDEFDKIQEQKTKNRVEKVDIKIVGKDRLIPSKISRQETNRLKGKIGGNLSLEDRQYLEDLEEVKKYERTATIVPDEIKNRIKEYNDKKLKYYSDVYTRNIKPANKNDKEYAEKIVRESIRSRIGDIDRMKLSGVSVEQIRQQFGMRSEGLITTNPKDSPNTPKDFGVDDSAILNVAMPIQKEEERLKGADISKIVGTGLTDGVSVMSIINLEPFKGLSGNDYRTAIAKKHASFYGYDDETSNNIIEAVKLITGNPDSVFVDFSTNEPYESVEDTIAKNALYNKGNVHLNLKEDGTEEYQVQYEDREGMIFRIGEIARQSAKLGLPVSPENLAKRYKAGQEYLDRNKKSLEIIKERALLAASGDDRTLLGKFWDGLQSIYSAWSYSQDSYSRQELFKAMYPEITDDNPAAYNIRTTERSGITIKELTYDSDSSMKRFSALNSYKEHSQISSYYNILSRLPDDELVKLAFLPTTFTKITDDFARLVGLTPIFEGVLKRTGLDKEITEIAKNVPSTTQLGELTGMILPFMAPGVGHIAGIANAAMVMHHQLKYSDPTTYNVIMASTLFGMGAGRLAYSLKPILGLNKIAGFQIALGAGQNLTVYGVNPEAFKNADGTFNPSEFIRQVTLDTALFGFDVIDFAVARGSKNPVEGLNILFRNSSGDFMMFVKNPVYGSFELGIVSPENAKKWQDAQISAGRQYAIMDVSDAQFDTLARNYGDLSTLSRFRLAITGDLEHPYKSLLSAAKLANQDNLDEFPIIGLSNLNAISKEKPSKTSDTGLKGETADTEKFSGIKEPLIFRIEENSQAKTKDLNTLTSQELIENAFIRLLGNGYKFNSEALPIAENPQITITIGKLLEKNIINVDEYGKITLTDYGILKNSELVEAEKSLEKSLKKTSGRFAEDREKILTGTEEEKNAVIAKFTKGVEEFYGQEIFAMPISKINSLTTNQKGVLFRKILLGEAEVDYNLGLVRNAPFKYVDSEGVVHSFGYNADGKAAMLRKKLNDEIVSKIFDNIEKLIEESDKLITEKGLLGNLDEIGEALNDVKKLKLKKIKKNNEDTIGKILELENKPKTEENIQDIVTEESKKIERTVEAKKLPKSVSIIPVIEGEPLDVTKTVSLKKEISDLGVVRWVTPTQQIISHQTLKDKITKGEYKLAKDQDDWWLTNREIAKQKFKNMSGAVKSHQILDSMSIEEKKEIYKSTADLVNLATFGTTNRAWREAREASGKKVPDNLNMRDYATVDQILKLNAVQQETTRLIETGITPTELAARIIDFGIEYDNKNAEANKKFKKGEKLKGKKAKLVISRLEQLFGDSSPEAKEKYKKLSDLIAVGKTDSTEITKILKELLPENSNTKQLGEKYVEARNIVRFGQGITRTQTFVNKILEILGMTKSPNLIPKFIPTEDYFNNLRNWSLGSGNIKLDASTNVQIDDITWNLVASPAFIASKENSNIMYVNPSMFDIVQMVTGNKGLSGLTLNNKSDLISSIDRFRSYLKNKSNLKDSDKLKLKALDDLSNHLNSLNNDNAVVIIDLNPNKMDYQNFIDIVTHELVHKLIFDFVGNKKLLDDVTLQNLFNSNIGREVESMLKTNPSYSSYDLEGMVHEVFAYASNLDTVKEEFGAKTQEQKEAFIAFYGKLLQAISAEHGDNFESVLRAHTDERILNLLDEVNKNAEQLENKFRPDFTRREIFEGGGGRIFQKDDVGENEWRGTGRKRVKAVRFTKTGNPATINNANKDIPGSTLDFYRLDDDNTYSITLDMESRIKKDNLIGTGVDFVSLNLIDLSEDYGALTIYNKSTPESFAMWATMRGYDGYFSSKDQTPQFKLFRTPEMEENLVGLGQRGLATTIAANKAYSIYDDNVGTGSTLDSEHRSNKLFLSKNTAHLYAAGVHFKDSLPYSIDDNQLLLNKEFLTNSLYKTKSPDNAILISLIADVWNDNPYLIDENGFSKLKQLTREYGLFIAETEPYISAHSINKALKNLDKIIDKISINRFTTKSADPKHFNVSNNLMFKDIPLNESWSQNKGKSSDSIINNKNIIFDILRKNPDFRRIYSRVTGLSGEKLDFDLSKRDYTYISKILNSYFDQFNYENPQVLTSLFLHSMGITGVIRNEGDKIVKVAFDFNTLKQLKKVKNPEKLPDRVTAQMEANIMSNEKQMRWLGENAFFRREDGTPVILRHGTFKMFDEELTSTNSWSFGLHVGTNIAPETFTNTGIYDNFFRETVFSKKIIGAPALKNIAKYINEHRDVPEIMEKLFANYPTKYTEKILSLEDVTEYIKYYLNNESSPQFEVEPDTGLLFIINRLYGGNYAKFLEDFNLIGKQFDNFPKESGRIYPIISNITNPLVVKDTQTNWSSHGNFYEQLNEAGIFPSKVYDELILEFSHKSIPKESFEAVLKKLVPKEKQEHYEKVEMMLTKVFDNKTEYYRNLPEKDRLMLANVFMNSGYFKYDLDSDTLTTDTLPFKNDSKFKGNVEIVIDKNYSIEYEAESARPIFTFRENNGIKELLVKNDSEKSIAKLELFDIFNDVIYAKLEQKNPDFSSLDFGAIFSSISDSMLDFTTKFYTENLIKPVMDYLNPNLYENMVVKNIYNQNMFKDGKIVATDYTKFFEELETEIVKYFIFDAGFDAIQYHNYLEDFANSWIILRDSDFVSVFDTNSPKLDQIPQSKPVNPTISVLAKTNMAAEKFKLEYSSIIDAAKNLVHSSIQALMVPNAEYLIYTGKLQIDFGENSPIKLVDNVPHYLSDSGKLIKLHPFGNDENVNIPIDVENFYIGETFQAFADAYITITDQKQLLKKPDYKDSKSVENYKKQIELVLRPVFADIGKLAQDKDFQTKKKEADYIKSRVVKYKAGAKINGLPTLIFASTPDFTKNFFRSFYTDMFKSEIQKDGTIKIISDTRNEVELDILSQVLNNIRKQDKELVENAEAAANIFLLQSDFDLVMNGGRDKAALYKAVLYRELVNNADSLPPNVVKKMFSPDETMYKIGPIGQGGIIKLTNKEKNLAKINTQIDKGILSDPNHENFSEAWSQLASEMVTNGFLDKSEIKKLDKLIKRGDVQDLTRFVTGLNNLGYLELIVDGIGRVPLLLVWNNLVKNLAGNSLRALNEEISRNLSIFPEMVFYGLGGAANKLGFNPEFDSRIHGFNLITSPLKYLKITAEALTKGTWEGLKDSWKTLRELQDVNFEHPKFSRKRTTGLEINLFGKTVKPLAPFEFYIRKGWAFQGALDRPFNKIAFRLALGEIKFRKWQILKDMTIIDGITKEVLPKVTWENVENYLSGDDYFMATEMAMRATFQDPNRLAATYYDINEALPPVFRALANNMFKFVKTPANISDYVLDHSGIWSIAKQIFDRYNAEDFSSWKQEIKDIFNKPERRAVASEIVTKAGIGALAMYMGSVLWNEGYLIPEYEWDERRENRELEVRQVGHGDFIIDGKSIDSSWATPYIFYMFLGAKAAKSMRDFENNYRKAYDEYRKLLEDENSSEIKLIEAETKLRNISNTNPTWYVLTKALVQALDQTANQTPILANIRRALLSAQKEDYSGLTGALGIQPELIVPGALKELADYNTPVKKMVRTDNWMNNLKDKIKMRIPDLGQSSLTNPFDEKILKDIADKVKNFHKGTMADDVDFLGKKIQQPSVRYTFPFRGTIEQTDPLLKEMNRLDVQIPTPKITDKYIANEQMKKRADFIVPKLNSLISSEDYKNLGENYKKELMESVINYLTRPKISEKDRQELDFQIMKITDKKKLVEKIMTDGLKNSSVVLTDRKVMADLVRDNLNPEDFTLTKVLGSLSKSSAEKFVNRLYNNRFVIRDDKPFHEVYEEYQEFVNNPVKYIIEFAIKREADKRSKQRTGELRKTLREQGMNKEQIEKEVRKQSAKKTAETRKKLKGKKEIVINE